MALLDDDRWAALFEAAANGYLNVVNRLLEMDIDSAA